VSKYERLFFKINTDLFCDKSLSEFSELLIILFASQSYLDNIDWHAKVS